MSRPARRPRSFLGAVVLIAVLAITAGWNAPPPRSGAGAAGIPATQLLQAAAALRAARVDLAIERDGLWDARATAAGTGSPAAIEPAQPGEPGPPGEPAEPADNLSPNDQAVERGPLDGARTVAAADIAPQATGGSFRGVNHVWMPAIGLSQRVVAFPCPRKRPPDNYMYRWGCARDNNVYLLGHAYSVMKPLYDAYMAGRLRVGMEAIYADGTGRIRTYRVTEWRVVDPVEGVWWAIAAQPVPSMTLQTCVGKYSQWRLNVRLVAVD